MTINLTNIPTAFCTFSETATCGGQIAWGNTLIPGTTPLFEDKLYVSERDFQVGMHTLLTKHSLKPTRWLATPGDKAEWMRRALPEFLDDPCMRAWVEDTNPEAWPRSNDPRLQEVAQDLASTYYGYRAASILMKNTEGPLSLIDFCTGKARYEDVAKIASTHKVQRIESSGNFSGIYDHTVASMAAHLGMTKDAFTKVRAGSQGTFRALVHDQDEFSAIEMNPMRYISAAILTGLLAPGERIAMFGDALYKVTPSLSPTGMLGPVMSAPGPADGAFLPHPTAVTNMVAAASVAPPGEAIGILMATVALTPALPAVRSACNDAVGRLSSPQVRPVPVADLINLRPGVAPRSIIPVSLEDRKATYLKLGVDYDSWSAVVQRRLDNIGPQATPSLSRMPRSPSILLSPATPRASVISSSFRSAARMIPLPFAPSPNQVYPTHTPSTSIYSARSTMMGPRRQSNH